MSPIRPGNTSLLPKSPDHVKRIGCRSLKPTSEVRMSRTFNPAITNKTISSNIPLNSRLKSATGKRQNIVKLTSEELRLFNEFKLSQLGAGATTGSWL